MAQKLMRGPLVEGDLNPGQEIGLKMQNLTGDRELTAQHGLFRRRAEVLPAGGLINRAGNRSRW